MTQLKNYYSKRTKMWASVTGDLLLILIPIVGTLIQEAPNLNEAQKYWWAGAFTTCSIAIKFLLKTIKNEEVTD
jgi:hypothetical protein